jgi:peptide/nickel transport system substrate-binding protein
VIRARRAHRIVAGPANGAAATPRAHGVAGGKVCLLRGAGTPRASRAPKTRANRRTIHRRTRTVALAAAVGLAATAAEANTLRWACQGDVLTLDPYAHTESFTSSFLHHRYAPLVRRDANLDFEPAPATSWEVVEPTRVRFTLREGVTFHNGNPFTADHVVAPIERLLHPDARARGSFAAVTAAEPVDDQTVDLVTDRPIRRG